LENIEFKELSSKDINDNLLDHFYRYQKIKKHWIKNCENWTLIDEEYIEDWDKNRKSKKINYFSNILYESEGHIFGAYENKKLIGFSLLLKKIFGVSDQYIQLKNLHVSLDYRHKGIGKKLFELCIIKAKEIGAEKMYISANDSEETIKFYFSIGCKDATEINKEIAEEEPYDRQLEYIIG
jgi:N-acetylglutamate synthase-like GNAT family acetyltransferase